MTSMNSQLTNVNGKVGVGKGGGMGERKEGGEWRKEGRGEKYGMWIWELKKVEEAKEQKRRRRRMEEENNNEKGLEKG